MRTAYKELAAVHFEDSQAVNVIATTLRRCLPETRPLIWLCIGSDRSTGDALGPLVGTLLTKYGVERVFGTLTSTVHAENLNATYAMITRSYVRPYIIAVDAMLTSALARVGYVLIRNEPLAPGTGVYKNNLTRVGDMSIVGAVNIGGMLEYQVLMTTPLSRVAAIADVIAKGIASGLAMREVVNDAAATI